MDGWRNEERGRRKGAEEGVRWMEGGKDRDGEGGGIGVRWMDG